MNQLQEKVRKYMTDKPAYRAQNLSYMRYEMKMMSQEDLIDQLKEMNLKELQYCQGAGVPGDANTIVLQLIRKRKEDMIKYLETKGSERIEKTKFEISREGGVTVSTEDKDTWVDKPSEENLGDEDAVE